MSEAQDCLQEFQSNLLQIDRDGVSSDSIDALYRSVHSLKGNAYLFGYQQLGVVSHAIESLVDPVRNQKAEVSKEILDLLYTGTELIQEIISEIATSGTENSSEEKLSKFIGNVAALVSTMFQGEFVVNAERNVSFFDLEAEKKLQVEKHSHVQKQENIPVNTTTPQQSDLLTKGQTMKEQQKPSHSQNAGSETLRIPVKILNKLMNLAGELVLIRNQHIQHSKDIKDNHLDSLNQRLNTVTSEIQDEVMKTRMQPISNIVTKFHRITRDLAGELGKEVHLDMKGTETELDKTLLEAINDPLVHLVRNAIDHGIENPDDREAAGKARHGTIKINSFHEGGQVVIEINDDGAGLSRERISAKIIEKGLGSQESLEKMSDREIFMKIFAAGFSTAARVSNVSGRGVGMDVVRTNIESIGGTIDLHSIEGSGTTIKLNIPLTLAIIPALIVKAGGQQFAIPQVKLVELVNIKVGEENARHHIEWLQGRPVFRLRGEIIPLVNLNEVLNREKETENDFPENVVVLQSVSGLFGLGVDAVEDSTDIVIKPLIQFIKDLRIFSGSTVLGDGNVALALDIAGLAERCGLGASIESDTDEKERFENRSLVDEADYLVVDVGAPGHYGIPLCLVNRLEKIGKNKIEMSGSRRVVRYRGGILPLISIADSLNLPFPSSNVKQNSLEGMIGSNQSAEEELSVVVIEMSNSLFGLEFKEIIDIITAESNIDSDLRDRPEIMGNLIIGEKIIVLIDVFEVIRGSGLAGDIPAFEKNTSQETKSRNGHTILLVEDNSFFRKQVSDLLFKAGYKVETAVDGSEGLKFLKQKKKQFALVVSDIEMPHMDGYQLASEVSKDKELQSIPMVALTTRFRKGDIERGTQAGFTKYLEKLHPNQLLSEIDQVLGI